MIHKIRIRATWKSSHLIEVEDPRPIQDVRDAIESGEEGIWEQVGDQITSATAELTDWEALG